MKKAGKYDIYGEESGWLGFDNLNTMAQAEKALKELLEFDKRQEIEDVYEIRQID